MLSLDVLDRSVALARRRGCELAVLFVDVDRFKDTNDRLGRRAGGELLIEAAMRLRQAVREGDTVARVGGDEFALFEPAIGTDRTGTPHLHVR